MKCLVVGNGPSFRKNMDFIKKFDGIIISTDRTMIPLVEAGIIPEYVITFEVKEGVIVEYYPFSYIQYKDRITAVLRKHAINVLHNRLGKLRFKKIIFESGFLGSINNVGLYSMYFACEYLNADEVYFVGLDHTLDDEFNEYFQKQMIESFKFFLNYYGNKKKIINCGEGLLFMEPVIDGRICRLQ